MDDKINFNGRQVRLLEEKKNVILMQIANVFSHKHNTTLSLHNVYCIPYVSENI